MTKPTENTDATRLERIAKGLPPDVHDAETEAAYEAHGKRGKTKATTKKGSAKTTA